MNCLSSEFPLFQFLAINWKFPVLGLLQHATQVWRQALITYITFQNGEILEKGFDFFIPGSIMPAGAILQLKAFHMNTDVDCYIEHDNTTKYFT